MCKSTGNLYISVSLYTGKAWNWYKNVKYSLTHEYDASGKRYMEKKAKPFGLDRFLKPSITEEQILSCFE